MLGFTICGRSKPVEAFSSIVSDCETKFVLFLLYLVARKGLLSSMAFSSMSL